MNRLIVVLLALAVTIPVGITSRRSAQNAAPAAFSAHTSVRAIVRVSGDVPHPGIYSITANKLTIDAIEMADSSWRPKSLVPFGSGSLPLNNGTDIRVTRNPDGSAGIEIGMIPVSQRIVLQLPLDVNTMTEADFEQLPGIGPVLAQRIINYRQNNGGKLAPDDLLAIEGIGEKKYNQIKRYFK